MPLAAGFAGYKYRVRQITLRAHNFAEELERMASVLLTKRAPGRSSYVATTENVSGRR